MQWVRNRNHVYGRRYNPSKWHILEKIDRDVELGWHKTVHDVYTSRDNYAFAGIGKDIVDVIDTLPTRGGVCGECLKVWLDTNSATQSVNS